MKSCTFPVLGIVLMALALYSCGDKPKKDDTYGAMSSKDRKALSQRLNTTGMEHYKKKQYGDALHQFIESSKADPENFWPAFNAACVYSLRGKKKEALGYLEKAFKLYKGHRKDPHLDPDFNRIRNSEGFKILVKQYISAGQKTTTISELKPVLGQWAFCGNHEYYREYYTIKQDGSFTWNSRSESGKDGSVRVQDGGGTVQFTSSYLVFRFARGPAPEKQFVYKKSVADINDGKPILIPSNHEMKRDHWKGVYFFRDAE